MKTAKLLQILCIGGWLVATGCSSSNDAKKSSNNQGPGVLINLDGGSGSPTGTQAQDTPDGLESISAATATALEDPATACQGWASEPEGGLPPVLEFVIDVTGSMADQRAYPNDPTNPATKWQETQRVLPGVFQSLPSTWAVGISYFRKPDNGCFVADQSVPIGVLNAAQQTSITDSIQRRGPKNDTNAADNVQGATPTLAAWRYGLSQLQSWTAPAGYEQSPRYIVLITDGVPTVNADGCTYVNPITQAEFDAEVNIVQMEGQAASIKTFVVGVLGSEQTQNATYDPLYMLSRLAVAGRTEEPPGCVPLSGAVNTSVTPTVLTTRGSYCHYDLSTSTDYAQALIDALGSIANSVISCNYTVPTPPAGQIIQPDKTVMVYNDGSGSYYLVLENTAASCDRGWQFTDTTSTAIEICDITCKLLQDNPNARLSLVFGCTSGQIVQ
jgi:hypothetical protein